MSAENFIIVSFTIPAAILTIFLNTIFLITLLKTYSLHSPSNVLLGVLCVTDLLAGVLCQPLFTAILLSKLGSFFSSLIKAYNFVFTLSSMNSFICSLLITLDRCAAIHYPYKYLERATCRKYVYTSFGLFILSVLHAAIIFLLYSASKVVFWSIEIVLQLLIIMAILTMYVKIYRVVLSKRNQHGGLRERSRISRTERSRTHTVTIILAVFIACYAPYAAYCIDSVLYFLGKVGDSTKLGLWAQFFVLLNSCLNPIVYCARSRQIRKAAVRMFMPNSRFARDSTNSMANVKEKKNRGADQSLVTTVV